MGKTPTKSSLMRVVGTLFDGVLIVDGIVEIKES
jgi:hypothetical protein